MSIEKRQEEAKKILLSQKIDSEIDPRRINFQITKDEIKRKKTNHKILLISSLAFLIIVIYFVFIRKKNK